MAVKLRKRKISNTKESLYLDIYFKGNRKIESLGMYLHINPNDEIKRSENRSTKLLAQEICAKRQLEIAAKGHDVIQLKKPTELRGYFDKLMKDLKSKGRESYWEIHKFTMKSIEKFIKAEYGRNKITFQEIDYQFLKRFESFLFGNGCSSGGISVYMRTLRTAYNEAIKEGLVNRSNYPFSTPQNQGYDISKLKSKPNPKALSIEDMEKIKSFPVNEYPELKKATLYFLFSYYARGMNFRDMAQLKKSDIYNGRINYTRLKTGGFLSIKVSDPIIEILQEFDDKESEFLFPILNHTHRTPSQVQNRIKKCLKEYNKDLKAIAKILDIKVSLTSYVARHTYATTLKHKGVDIGIISEGMGHQNVNVTKNYLKNFSDEVVDEADGVL